MKCFAFLISSHYRIFAACCVLTHRVVRIRHHSPPNLARFSIPLLLQVQVSKAPFFGHNPVLNSFALIDTTVFSSLNQFSNQPANVGSELPVGFVIGTLFS